MGRVSIRIHHLSDVHFGDAHYRPESKLPIFPASTFRNSTAYLNHIERLDPDLFPDLVIISGDLATRASEEEMGLAEEFIAKISGLDAWKHRTRLPERSPRVLIVPGNHDLDWARAKPDERHERFGRLAEVVRQDRVVLSSWYRLQRHEPWFDFGDGANLFVYLLNSTPYGGTEDPILSQIYEAIAHSAGQLGLTPDAIKAFSHQVRRDPGFVRDQDLDRLREAAAKVPKRRIKVAVVHHNPNHVPSDDRETFDTIVNGGALKAALLEAGFHVVLHGHRHTFHCSAEWHPGASFGHHQCYFVSADSLGCREHAPFLELLLTQDGSGDSDSAQGSTLTIREFRYSHPNGYSEGAAMIETPLVPSDAEQLARAILSEGTQGSSSVQVKRAVSRYLKKLRDLQYNLSQWAEDTKWVKQFHFQLQTYRRIWATALYDGQTLLNPVYQRYLREQYTERLNRLGQSKEKVLYYSPDVMRAIVAHAWHPSAELWSDYTMQRIERASPSSLEIARIMIVDSPDVDLTALENLAYDHSLCAIPLFVLESKHMQSDAIDFAIGMDADGNPIKGCALDEKTGAVSEQASLVSYDLIAAFESMLSNPHLKTAHEYVGRQRMWTQRAAELTKKYAQLRKPSSLLVNTLNKHFPPSAETGLDMCCGTGNYTAPAQQHFTRVIGLDISPEMIEEAKTRVKGVEWVVRDAKDSGQPANSCDAVWMISALHYFRGEEQVVLFGEIWRILKPGGVFIADTEFLEQHPSLWIVDYFPSLKKRYADALFAREKYREWLAAAGFSSIKFEVHDYKPEEGDAFLRIGQHKPKLYLDQRIREAIPAFQLMDPAERTKGLQRLRDEIDTGETARIQQQYISRAQLPGDLGIIIATK